MSLGNIIDIPDLPSFSSGEEFDEDVIDIHTTRDGDIPNTGTLFTRLMFDFFFKDSMRSALRSEDEEFFSIQNYNLRNPRNGIEKAKQKRTVGYGQSRTPRIIADELPNQIKSLFRSSYDGSQVVKSNYFDMGEPDPFKDPKTSVSFLLNYMSLAQILVFNGFAVGADNEQFMKLDFWTKLTVEIFQRAKQADQALLCKIMPYSNRAYGVFAAKGLQLPIYDKYFILSPGRALPRRPRNILVTEQNNRRKINNVISNLSLRSKNYNREYMSVAVSEIPGGIPTPPRPPARTGAPTAGPTPRGGPRTGAPSTGPRGRGAPRIRASRIRGMRPRGGSRGGY